MTILRGDIIRALEEMIVNEAGTAFQALAVVLAKQKWPDLIASEWHNDGGLDAYAPAALTGDKKGKGVASSLTATLSKVKGDVTTAKENYPDLEFLVFITPRKVTAETARQWAEELQKTFAVGLRVMSREDIITSLLLPSNEALCRTLPGLSSPLDRGHSDQNARIRAAIAEEAHAWRIRQRLTDRPIISLNASKLDSDGRETSEVFDVAALRSALSESRRISLEAPGGAGKTTTLVQLASGLPVDGELTFLVDLPAWIRSGTDILEFISRGAPFRAREITAQDLARLAQQTHFSFLLNGWNEIGEINSESAVTALTELERNFPAAGILVATRTHYISPPLPGAVRAKLLPFTRRQRAHYLRQTLGERAEELRLHLLANHVLDELTRTPLILAEVVSIFESGSPIPTTRIGVLGSVMNLVEAAPLHRPYIQLQPLSNKSEDFLSRLATEMTMRGEVLIGEADARAAIRSASEMLIAKGQISTAADPGAILTALTAHHVLEQIDHPTTEPAPEICTGR